MVMRMALSNANVEGPNGETFQTVYVETRGDQLLVRTKQGEQLVDVTASSVTRQRGNRYEVQTADGVWRIQRQGCGCAGSR